MSADSIILWITVFNLLLRLLSGNKPFMTLCDLQNPNQFFIQSKSLHRSHSCPSKQQTFKFIWLKWRLNNQFDFLKCLNLWRESQISIKIIHIEKQGPIFKWNENVGFTVNFVQQNYHVIAFTRSTINLFSFTFARSGNGPLVFKKGTNQTFYKGHMQLSLVTRINIFSVSFVCFILHLVDGKES